MVAVLFPLCSLRADAKGQEGTRMGPSYFAAQADRRLNLYVSKCASCHGSSLQGGSGAARRRSVSVALGESCAARPLLCDRQADAVKRSGSLSGEEDFDLIAFILRKNDYHSGLVRLDIAQAYSLLFEGGVAPTAAENDAPPFDDAELLRAGDADWLMYNRDYRGRRYSGLKQINALTAPRLRAVCAFQLGQLGPYPASPVIYKGKLYITATSSTYATVASGNSSRVTWGIRWHGDNLHLCPSLSATQMGNVQLRVQLRGSEST